MAKEQLVADLRTMIALLDTYHVEHWSGWFSACLRQIEAGDVYGLQHVLDAFGGMGSLNDLLIHPTNGHPIDPRDVEAVDRELHDLREAVWSRATALLSDRR